ncbi:hypothetical protein V496_08810 [Pseudogymnoascus sp. VKM F-4515 (FW-2607)]|nr:hypothetical protein V496_08810 [Pseudogymnoascus sp. VKM F-4515 (FW-2607)]KFY82968.1 hypothetical protein V498_08369 [Pseudogymnoascus sp. VKM F-4517 (FW-2822)]
MEAIKMTPQAIIVEWAQFLWQERGMAQMYTHLVLAALFPIYAGAHASLRRPPSAAIPVKKKRTTKEEDEDSEDEDLEVEQHVGLTPSDAIMFPILAGFTLSGLYFLIKWLKDPALLNQILGYYFSTLGVFGVGKLATDALNVSTSVVFPNMWSSKGQIYHINQTLSAQLIESPSPGPETKIHRRFVEAKTNPFPSVFSRIRFPERTTKRIWATRALLNQHWIFRGYIHGILSVKSRVRLNDALGFFIGVACIALYNMNGKPWYLTNLMGFGFCYGSLQLMSPTTFWTGSLVMGGLFIYDIIMVFYTPLMITVATTLDAPMMLVVPGPNRGSMLGLGDIVLPGIMIGLALRFDLYLHYLRKGQASSDIALPSYKKPTASQTGDLFWTSCHASLRPAALADAAFRKTYFHAALTGYVAGMAVTLAVLNIWNHAQPALLYLVPGVLIALWGTALVRGEIGVMWRFTESGDDIKDVKAGVRVEEKKKEEEGEVKEGEEVKVRMRGVKNYGAREDFVTYFTLSTPKGEGVRERVGGKSE